MSKPMKLTCTLQCHSVSSLAMRECQIHTLIPTAQVDLLCRQVDLLSAAHSCTDLQQLEMVGMDKKDTGGAMEAHTHNAKQQWTINFNRKDNYFMHKTQYTLDIERDWEEIISLIHRALTSLHGLHFFFLTPKGKRELSPKSKKCQKSKSPPPLFKIGFYT